MTAAIPPGITKMIKAGQKSKKLCPYIAGKALTMRANLGFGPVRIDRDQLPWVQETLRAYHKNKRASEVRHVVFALPKGLSRDEAIKTLLKIALDWIDEYAPGRAWLFGVHNDNGFYHGHLAVANTGEDGKALQIDQYDVRNMAAMKFTRHAANAKGTGMNVGLPGYSKAAQSDLRDVAELLIDDRGNLRNDRWQEMIEAGKITDIFVNKRTGEPRSFKYQGRFLGFDALDQFLQHEQIKKHIALDEDTAPAPSIPLSDLLARVAKATPTAPASTPVSSGLDPEVLNELLDELNPLQPRAPRLAKPKIKPPELPPL